jgi:hypothetical protein
MPLNHKRLEAMPEGCSALFPIKRVYDLRVFLVCLACASAGAAGQTTPQVHQPNGKSSAVPVDLNQPFVPLSTETHPCGDVDWKLLDLKSTQTLLADYGFNILPPWTCLAAVVPWLPTARIIRLKESLGLDNYPEFTLIQSSSDSRLWVIPIEHGMVGYPHNENNPHNIAAFNDLLRAAKHKPGDDLLIELGNLYQFIVGSEEWFDPERMPKTIEQSLKVNDIMWMIQRDADGVTLKHREFFGDRWTHSYMIWEFCFKKSAQGLRLASVERGPLDPVTDDIKEP